MNKQHARAVLGLFLVFSHVGLIGLMLCAPLYGLFMSSALEFVAIVSPVFGGLTAKVVSYLIANKDTKVSVEPEKYSIPYVIISATFPLALVCSIGFVFLSHSLDVFPISMGQTKAAIAALEACFAVYVGLVVDSMFNGSPEPTKA